MKDSDRYFKFVEWSDEAQCYIGTCPELFGAGCRGDNEAKVYKKLCELVEWIVETNKKDGIPIPEPKFRNTVLRGNECFYDYFGNVLLEEAAASKLGKSSKSKNLQPQISP